MTYFVKWAELENFELELFETIDRRWVEPNIIELELWLLSSNLIELLTYLIRA